MHELILSELFAQFYLSEQISIDMLVKKIFSVFHYLTFFNTQSSWKFIRAVSKEHRKQFSSGTFCRSPFVIKLQSKSTTLFIKGCGAGVFL